MSHAFDSGIAAGFLENAELVAGFSARRRARRVRTCIAQSAEFVSSSFPA